MIKKIEKLVQSLWHVGGLPNLLRARPRSVTSWLVCNRLRALNLRFRTIVDGGANVGQFARAAHTLFPEANIISFEPLPDVAAEVRENLEDVERHQVIEAALGPCDGGTTFYRHQYNQSSSVRQMLMSQNGLMRRDWELEALKVPLDSAMDGQYLQEPVLLKLDLQGYELEALRGARESSAAVAMSCSKPYLSKSTWTSPYSKPFGST